MDQKKVTAILDAILVTASKPQSLDKLHQFFDDTDNVSRQDVRQSIDKLSNLTADRGFTLVETASGFRYQSKEDYQHWVAKHWQEKTPRYSRAFLETLALIIYRQPITRAEIEEIRGVAVSSNIIKSLKEREWVRVVGHKEVPGRPAMLGTTRQLLDYFNLKSLDQMPPLSDIQDIDKLYPELDLQTPEAMNDQQLPEEENESP